jgi:hypothetical protein
MTALGIRIQVSLLVYAPLLNRLVIGEWLVGVRGRRLNVALDGAPLLDVGVGVADDSARDRG